MAKLKAYNTREVPGVAPAVKFYDGRDFFNIAGTASKFRKAADEMALNKALAMAERELSQEVIAQTENPDSYYGDIEKANAARVAQLQEKAAAGDVSAQNALRLSASSGVPPQGTFRNFTDYQDRQDQARQRIIEETGITGKQLDQFNLAVYRKDTEMLQTAELSRDLLIDTRIFQEQISIFNEHIDAGDYASGIAVAESLYKAGRISIDKKDEMLQAAYKQEDVDLITNTMDEKYAANPDVGLVQADIDAWINDDTLWDGSGLENKEQRLKYVQEYAKILDVKNQDREATAASTISENYRVGSDAKNLMLEGKMTMEEYYAEIRKQEDLLVESMSGNIQDPDKINERQQQSLIDYMRAAIPKAADTGLKSDQMAYIYSQMANEVARKKALGWGESQIQAWAFNEKFAYKGEEIQADYKMWNQFFPRDPVALVAKANAQILANTMQMQENGVDQNIINQISTDQYDWVQNNVDQLNDITVENIKQSMNDAMVKKITNDTTTNTKFGSGLLFWKGTNESKWNSQMADIESRVGMGYTFTERAATADAMNLLRDQTLEAKASIFTNPDLQTPEFQASKGANFFQDQSRVYNGFSNDPSTRGGLLIAVPKVEGGNVQAVTYANNSKGVEREIMLAGRDKYSGDENSITIDTRQDDDETYVAQIRMSADGRFLQSQIIKYGKPRPGQEAVRSAVDISVPSTPVAEQFMESFYQPNGGGAWTEAQRNSIAIASMVLQDHPDKYNKLAEMLGAKRIPGKYIDEPIREDFFDDVDMDAPEDLMGGKAIEDLFKMIPVTPEGRATDIRRRGY